MTFKNEADELLGMRRTASGSDWVKRQRIPFSPFYLPKPPVTATVMGEVPFYFIIWPYCLCFYSRDGGLWGETAPLVMAIVSGSSPVG